MRVTELVRQGILYPALARGSELVQEKKIMLKDITKEELKHEIRNLFSNGQTLYYSDIAEQLGVNLKSVVDVCRELQENREIGVDESVPEGAH